MVPHVLTALVVLACALGGLVVGGPVGLLVGLGVGAGFGPVLVSHARD